MDTVSDIDQSWDGSRFGAEIKRRLSVSSSVRHAEILAEIKYKTERLAVCEEEAESLYARGSRDDRAEANGYEMEIAVLEVGIEELRDELQRLANPLIHNDLADSVSPSDTNK